MKDRDLTKVCIEERAYIPLAERMRPTCLDEIVGYDYLIGRNSVLGNTARQGQVFPSLVLAGPPGSGKTAIAIALVSQTCLKSESLSGVLHGVAEVREKLIQAEQHYLKTGKPTVLLVDEIHRFNRAQQDIFLPQLEQGSIVMIGQTTENVSFRLRGALLSRLRVLQVKGLGLKDLEEIIDRAMTNKEKGLGNFDLTLTAEAKAALAKLAGGDARRVLNALDWAANRALLRESRDILLADVEEGFGSQPDYFDQKGDYHYDCISAFIKSMRGSDPDAALYYLIRALEAGEDPLFISRRMIIFAAEDACADPRALQIALAVDRAVERLGLPEARIPLAQGVVYLSCATKSNSCYKALNAMTAIVEKNPGLAVPKHLRNFDNGSFETSSSHSSYHYPHDYPNAFVPERYLPEALGNLRVYEPSERGIEQTFKERLRVFEQLIESRKTNDH